MRQEEIELIRSCTNWSDEVINHIGSFQEAQIYMKANLVEQRVGDRLALIRKDIDWTAFNCRYEWQKQQFADWQRWQDYNNADLIGEGYPPRDSNGDPYELHHIGQHHDSPFAELTWSEHMGDGNNTILHPLRESEIDRQKFATEKSQHWMARYDLLSKDELEKIYG